MLISTEINSSSSRIGFEKAVEAVANAGFDAWDFSLFRMAPFDGKTHSVKLSGHPLESREALAYARKLKQIGLDNGIFCNQSHAPFPVAIPAIWDKVRLAIEATAEAGGKICVIHPFHDNTPEENGQVYADLLPFAKECGVILATENMWYWNNELDQAKDAACSHHDNFRATMDALDDPFFTACLDIGHAEMKGLRTSAVEMIYALRGRLGALHIHDNDRRHDSHQIPFSMNIDFVPIVKALKEIGYAGEFTLEADAYLSSFPVEEIPAKLKDLADSARRLAEIFEKA